MEFYLAILQQSGQGAFSGPDQSIISKFLKNIGGIAGTTSLHHKALKNNDLGGLFRLTDELVEGFGN